MAYFCLYLLIAASLGQAELLSQQAYSPAERG